MLTAVSAPPPPVTVVVGAETLLSDRAVAAVIRGARRLDPAAEVSEVSGRDLTAGALAAHLSPSLFASRRVLVVRDLPEVDDAVADEIRGLAGDDGVDADAHLVLVHPGGVKGKAMLDAVRASGAHQIVCDRPKAFEDQVAFVRSEVQAHRGRIDEDAARRLVESVGTDLRALAAAAAQLVSDADGVVDTVLVGTYFEGRAEVKGWTIADRTVEGRIPQALEELTWALQTGTDPVLVTGALATSLRTLTRLAAVPQGVRDADAARDLAVPPWKVRTLRGQLRGWSGDGLAHAVRAVAAADVRVKGGSNNAAYALVALVIEIGRCRDG